MLRFELDASPDVVWEMLRDPRALSAVVAPLLEVEAVGHRRLPTRWTLGERTQVRVRLLGLLALGDQVIRLSASERAGARILEDSGGPVSGLLGIVTGWRHRMAVSPTADGRTLYRDRVDFSAGPLTPLAWPGMWLLWQWRAQGIRRELARRTAG